MSWSAFSAAPKGYGVTGGSASLTVGTSSQLVRCEVEGPQTWTVQLEATDTCAFDVLVGNGQSSRSVTFTVKGRSSIAVAAETIEVNAQCIASAAIASASVGIGSGTQTTPQDVASQVITLASVTNTDIAGTGRVFALIHNNTGAALSVRVKGVDIAQVANAATFRLDYGGSFSLYSTVGGNVSIAEFY